MLCVSIVGQFEATSRQSKADDQTIKGGTKTERHIRTGGRKANVPVGANFQ